MAVVREAFNLYQEYPLSDFMHTREQPKNGALVKVSTERSGDDYYVISDFSHYAYPGRNPPRAAETLLRIHGLKLPEDFRLIAGLTNPVIQGQYLCTDMSTEGAKVSEADPKLKMTVLALNYFEYLGRAKAALTPCLLPSCIQVVQEYMS
jgi:hypothetical protein